MIAIVTSKLIEQLKLLDERCTISCEHYRFVCSDWKCMDYHAGDLNNSLTMACLESTSLMISRGSKGFWKEALCEVF